MPEPVSSIALSSDTGSRCTPSRSTRSSISSTICSASFWRPCVMSHRGLSGMVRRRKMIPRPSSGPMKNASRQPRLTAAAAG